MLNYDKQLIHKKGRNILDGPLILNEVISWYQKRKKELMIFKVDFEKAFDSIRWDFLDLVMEKLGLSLIKSVLGNLPTYYMSLYMMQMAIQKKLEMMRNKFFIDGEEGEKKITWVKWEKCLASKKLGGLGIGSIYALNLGLIFKWIWRFLCHSNDLWACVITNIYGIKGGINEDRTHHTTWGVILSSVKRLKLKGIDLFSLCKRNLGNGSLTGFWDDNSPLLKYQFPRIHMLDSDKGCKVSNRLHVSDWSAFLRRLPRGGVELSQFSALLSSIRDITLSDQDDARLGNGSLTSFWDDTWCGNSPLKYQFPRIHMLDSDKGYKVSNRLHVSDWSAFLRRLPRGGVELSQFSVFLSSIRDITLFDQDDAWVWTLNNSSVNVFLWRLVLNKLPTRVNLDRKGIDVDSVLCPICCVDVEIANHVFFSCEMAKDLWALMARWWELDIPICSNFMEWCSWIDSPHLSSKAKLVLKGVGGSLLWSIWRFRNELIFSTLPPQKAILWDFIVSHSFLWISSRNPKFKLSWVEWMKNPLLFIDTIDFTFSKSTFRCQLSACPVNGIIVHLLCIYPPLAVSTTSAAIVGLRDAEVIPQVPPERKARVLAKIEHLQKIHNGNKSALKAHHWVSNPETGTYDVESIGQGRSDVPRTLPWQIGMPRLPSGMIPGTKPEPLKIAKTRQRARSYIESSATREYPSLIHTFFVTHTVGGVFTRDEDQAIYEEMLRLQGLGSNTLSRCTYTEEEINSLARKGKHRGKLSGVGRVLPGRATNVLSSPPPKCVHNSVDVKKLKKKNKYLTKQVNLMLKLFRSNDKFSQMLNQYESSPEFDNATRSGGYGDDEMADDENDDEDEEDEEDGGS
nr:RNA-directed DNA polymerase, eukaryota, reverse transcriptase zinc-binding domain protein [Tanacetum cinerariifolium]